MIESQTRNDTHRMIPFVEVQKQAKLIYTVRSYERVVFGKEEVTGRSREGISRKLTTFLSC